MFKKIRFRYVFVIYAIVLGVCVFSIYPAHDDFEYFSPHKNENLLLRALPTRTFWRPVERTYEYFLGHFPYLFPYLNQSIAFLGHLLLCLILYYILNNLTEKKIATWLGTLFFCLSPGIVQTTGQPDFIGQLETMMVGFISAIFFFKAYNNHKFLYYLGWFVFAFVATLIKENGIAWFLAPILLNITYTYSISNDKFLYILKRHLNFILYAIISMIIYFTLRFILQEISTGEFGVSVSHTLIATRAERYSVNFNVLNILKNYCIMLGGALTVIDPLAFFLKPRNWTILTITSGISFLFLFVILKKLCEIFINDKRIFVSLVLLLMCALFINSPYCVMGHVREGTAYEIVFFFSIILGVILANSSNTKFKNYVLAIMFICMICVSGHKFYVMHIYTSEVNSFLQEHKNDFYNIPSKIFVYYVEDIPDEGYSSYKYSLGHGLHRGYAFKSLWNWEPEVKTQSFKNMDDVNFTPESLPEYDTVFILTQSGSLKILRN